MRSFWIRQVGPKSHDKGLRDGRSWGEDKAAAGVREPQAKERQSPCIAGRGKDGSSPRAFTRSAALLAP